MNKIELIVIIGIVLIVALCIPAVIKRQEWLTDHCKIISRTAGTYGWVGENNVFIAGKTKYQCDDGVMYEE